MSKLENLQTLYRAAQAAGDEERMKQVAGWIDRELLRRKVPPGLKRATHQSHRLDAEFWKIVGK